MVNFVRLENYKEHDENTYVDINLSRVEYVELEKDWAHVTMSNGDGFLFNRSAWDIAVKVGK